ncbi:TetR/AcrR family transcriptional regulator [Streptomyces sp. NP160]|uniref:TetR/AcrR family transcriptional regulator n=1 Tax=Streptomyces sp. NP160 TaxID=2586637 RepID=UPI00111827DB|nr:TetR/AcrR family transcriptional regulator [Streptomyces sp. NP160]TNM64113.1 TetR/AcrR family transcriptional regulator [Streptomyces sp. NP160]
MTSRPFHHGNLRAALLDEAETVLRESGVEALSLRDLARRTGVSHGAPRSHFIDRQALLDSLAERGFDRFTESIRSALHASTGSADRLRRVGRAYVDFAVDEAALVELMFSAKVDGGSDRVRDAAARLFGTLDSALSPPADDDDAHERERFGLLFAATLQGTAALVTSGRVSREQGRRIVEDAADALLASPLARRALPREGGPPAG